MKKMHDRIHSFASWFLPDMQHLPASSFAKNLLFFLGLFGFGTMFFGDVSANTNITTTLNNSVMTIEKLRVTNNGLPSGSWVVELDTNGVKINLGASTGVLRRGAGDYITQGLVVGTDIQDYTIDGTKIQNNAITDTKIASGSVTNNKIQDGVITCDKLNLGTFPGLSCAGGPVPNGACTPGQFLQGITATGGFICSPASGGTGSLPSCAPGQTVMYTGGSRQCVNPGPFGATGSSYWDFNMISEHIRNNNAGNVGIGTNNPSSKLTVSGSVKVWGNGTINTGVVTNPGTYLYTRSPNAPVNIGCFQGPVPGQNYTSTVGSRIEPNNTTTIPVDVSVNYASWNLNNINDIINFTCDITYNGGANPSFSITRTFYDCRDTNTAAAYMCDSTQIMNDMEPFWLNQTIDTNGMSACSTPTGGAGTLGDSQYTSNNDDGATCYYIVNNGNASIQYYTRGANNGGSGTGTLATADANSILYVGNGKVGILTSTPQYALDVVGTIRASSVITTSDARLKTNIKAIDNALASLLGINGYSYTLKSNGEKQYGVLAQEIEQFFPYIVSTDANGYKAVNYNGLIAPIIQAIHELDTKVQSIEAKYQSNEDRIKALETKLAK